MSRSVLVFLVGFIAITSAHPPFFGRSLKVENKPNLLPQTSHRLWATVSCLGDGGLKSCSAAYKGRPPCGLPPFIDKLPADAQKKLQEIWQNYKQGERCYNEHGLTRELLDSLPKEVRKAVFKNRPLPPPLMKAPQDVQEQFRAIFADRSIPYEEKPKKIHELAQKVLKGDTLKEFNDFHNRMEEYKKNIEEQAQRLSPEAKQAYDKLKDLRKQKHQIMQNLSEAARDELYDLWKEKRDSFPRPR